MVKIVGVDDSHVFRTSCPKCASILEYTKSETHKVKKNWDYRGDYDLVDCITCPKCSHEVSVK